MPASKPILEVQSLKNSYQTQASGLFGQGKRVEVLKDVSFDIQSGELFGLVGESGCGKSTLCKAVLGLIDYNGKVAVDGVVHPTKPSRAQRKNIQAVFQDPYSSLNPKKTVGWILEEPLRIHKIGSKEDRIKRVYEVLDLIGLDSTYQSRYPHELSGGQRQRICIGCALMLNPKLIIADEAVSALDVSVASQILNLFKDLHQRLNLSMLFISHNLNVVYYLCDRIAVMYKGSIVELSTAEEIYASPRHPYTKALLSAIPEIDEDRYHYPKNTPVVATEDAAEEMGGCDFYSRCPSACEQCKTMPPVLTNYGKDAVPHLVSCHFADTHT